LVSELQSYILSTTTETVLRTRAAQAPIRLQSYILSTTTETVFKQPDDVITCCFNRTSFQQQLKRCELASARAVWVLQSYILSTTTETKFSELNLRIGSASIVHPFNNNWNYTELIAVEFNL